MDRRHELRFQSYDRLFPYQDTLPKGGFGNLIALPFQGQAQRDGNTLFGDEYGMILCDECHHAAVSRSCTNRRWHAS